MRDITLEDTFYHHFTTRQFSDGIPTILAGTPVLSVLEENNVTPITAGVSVSVDRASVVGLNEATIIATAANGYELGKSYVIYISTGTVGGVSVIGEVVGHFTIAASAAAVDLAQGTDGLGAIKSDTAAILTDTGTTLDTKINDIQGATFSGATDSLEAIRDQGDAAWITGAGGSDRLLMVDTTIATLASQTSFTLTAGSADDDAYNNCTIVIEDVSTATQKAIGLISAYTGASKTVTLKYDPAVFTIATTDKIYILAENALKSTDFNRQLDVTATGAAGIDWANVENPTTALDLSATDIQLCDTVTALSTAAIQLITRAVQPQINTALSDIEFLMVDTTDGRTPLTGLTVTGTVSLDGGAFGAVSGAIAEVGSGIYQFDAASGDMNGAIVTFRFAAGGADSTYITFKTTT